MLNCQYYNLYIVIHLTNNWMLQLPNQLTPYIKQLKKNLRKNSKHSCLFTNFILLKIIFMFTDCTVVKYKF